MLFIVFIKQRWAGRKIQDVAAALYIHPVLFEPVHKLGGEIVQGCFDDTGGNDVRSVSCFRRAQ